MGVHPSCSVSEVAPWIVINTHAHRERIALENLQRQAFETYCPMIRKRHAHARRVTTVLRPLFANYLFARIGTQRWHPILSTCGVRTVVQAGNGPGFIDNRFIESLRAREVDGAIIRPASSYRIGQQVHVCTGSFDKIVATIIEMGEKDRLVVLMDLMNRGVKVQVTSEFVSPI
jgi:transcriptional antiterminator RfaH